MSSQSFCLRWRSRLPRNRPPNLFWVWSSARMASRLPTCRGAAAAILARAISSFRKTDADTARQGFVAMALALIDPARVVALVESLPDEPSLERTLPKNFARLLVAELLAKAGEERWKAAREHAVSIWKPEGSDL
jgi:hypothetical protein